MAAWILLVVAGVALAVAMATAIVAASRHAARVRAVRDAHVPRGAETTAASLTPAEAAALHPRGGRGFAAELAALVAAGVLRVHAGPVAPGRLGGLTARRHWLVEILPAPATGEADIPTTTRGALDTLYDGHRPVGSTRTVPAGTRAHRRRRAAWAAEVDAVVVDRGLATVTPVWVRRRLPLVGGACAAMALVLALVAAIVGAVDGADGPGGWPWIIAVLAIAVLLVLPFVRAPRLTPTATGVVAAAALSERHGIDRDAKEPARPTPADADAANRRLALAIVLRDHVVAAERAARFAAATGGALPWSLPRSADEEGTVTGTPDAAAFRREIRDFVAVIGRDGRLGR